MTDLISRIAGIFVPLALIAGMLYAVGLSPVAYEFEGTAPKHLGGLYDVCYGSTYANAVTYVGLIVGLVVALCVVGMINELRSKI